MSGIGPAMDMAMETARGERVADAARPDASPPAPEAAAAATAGGDAPAAEALVQPAAGVTAAGPRDAAAAAIAQAAPVSSVAAPAEAAVAQPDVTTATATATADAAIAPIAPPAAATTLTTTQAPARPAANASPADAASLGGTVFALLLVVGLILALGWLAKRMPGFGRSASGNGLRVVASLPIGPRERVVVVEVGQTQLLLGVGPGGTRTLHTLAEPLPEAGTGPTPQFAQLLAQHFGKKA